MTTVGISNQFHWGNVGLKLLRWTVYSVIISLIPIFSTFLYSWTTNSQVTLTGALSKGELLLISVAISGGAVGELIGREAEGALRLLKVGIIGLTLIVVLVSCIWFGSIASILAEGGHVDAHAVSVGSKIVFFSSVLSGAVCIGMSSSEVS